MSAERHATLRRYFDTAAGLDEQGRAQLLRELRGQDESLAIELGELLHETAREGLLDGAVAQLASKLGEGLGEGFDSGGVMPGAGEVALPQAFGRFTLLSVLGRGGQGVVYRARQSSPAREVAVKIIASAAVSPGLARRFAHEAEALAMLTHPGIARVYDAGTEPFCGVACPYIAMELVEGKRLHEHVRDARAGVREVVGLLISVARSVDHAHKRGVIHRDLKPGNILVTPAPECQTKVLDFGVARLTRPSLAGQASGATLQGTAQQIIGTLAYMSPELASGNAQAVDLRSDVYALGVIAYELLCGRLPFATDRLTLPEALRAISRDDAPAPRTVAQHVPAEVEAIIVKAMARNPDERYQHASALAEDLERFLAGEPVSAKLYTRAERVRRFVRRNRAGVLAAGAVVLALSAGLVTTAWQASVARYERALAQQEAASSRATTALMQRILRAASPEVLLGREMTVREMLSSAEQELEAGSSDQNLAAMATARATLADARNALGDYSIAERHARAADELFTRAGQGEGASAIDNLCTLARVLKLQGRDQDARQMAERAYGAAQQRFGPGHTQTIEAAMTRVYTGKGTGDADRRAAIAQYRDLLEKAVRAGGEQSEQVDQVRSDLAVELEEVGERKEAFDIACRLYASRRVRLGVEHPLTLLALHNVATYTGEIGKLEPALKSLEKVIDARKRVLGAQHPSTLLSISTRLKFLLRQGKFEEALPEAHELARALSSTRGPVHRQTFEARGLHATCLLQLGRLDPAAEAIDALVRDTRAALGEGDEASQQAVTLAWDLAEARNDRDGLLRHARALRGSPFEQAVREQMKQKGLDMDALAPTVPAPAGSGR